VDVPPEPSLARSTRPSTPETNSCWSNDYGLGLAFLVLLMLTAALVTLGHLIGTATATAIVLAVLAVLGWKLRLAAATASGVIAWSLLNGFVIDQQGDLHWHGRADLLRLVLLIASSFGAGLARSVRRRYRRIPPRDLVPNPEPWAPET
jgi:K+-sensing histidine kinase KdpD